MLIVRQQTQEEQNPSAAPTLNAPTGVIGQGTTPTQQTRAVSPRTQGSGRFTNLQQYIQANEPAGGGLNPNAALIQRRAQEAKRGLETARTGFETQAGQVKSGLEGIQNIQKFVGGVLQNPTQAATRQADVQRFRNLATGQEAIARPTDIFGQFQGAREGLIRRQGEIASGLETDVGINLQNYIRSQRANPSIATQGENILDRFITEQAPTNIAQIEKARDVAQDIRSASTPIIASQVEELNRGLQNASFLTPESVQQAIETPAMQEEERLKNLNSQFVAEKTGLGGRVADPGKRFTDLEVAEYREGLINRYNQRISDLNSRILDNTNELNFLNNRFNELEKRRSVLTQDERNEATENRARARDLQNSINLTISERDPLIAGLSTVDMSLQPLLENYRNRLQNTRQQLLQEYDPATLAKIQALSQLSGRDVSELLGSRVV